jgi:putative tryptophan/tyrosine transport system substrate-binding protein
MRRREFIGLATVTAAWPLSARSQQLAKTYRLAIVHPTASVTDLTEQTHRGFYSLIFEELRRLGYIENQNLLVERWTAEGKAERYDEIATEVVARKPDAVFLPTGRIAMRFKRITSTLPMVVFTGTDPILFGLVENLSRPGANITGVTSEAGPALLGKYFQILMDLNPASKKIGFLAPQPGWQLWQPTLTATSQSMGISIVGPIVEAPLTEQEHRASLKSMIDDGIEGVVVSTVVESVAYRRMIAQLVQDHRLPAIYPYEAYVNAGGLISYTSDFRETSIGLAHHIDLVLKGTKPGDQPFLQATKFHLTINLTAARAIQLDIPVALLASADKVIE